VTFQHEAENNATWEVAETEKRHRQHMFADLWEQIEALEERVKVQGMHIQQVKLETDEGVGDHDDLPNGQKFLQLGRLQQKTSHWSSWMKRSRRSWRLMLKSAQTTSEEQLGRRKEQQQQRSGSSSSRMEHMKSSTDLFGTQVDSNNYRGSS
jgi:hypothetical protein